MFFCFLQTTNQSRLLLENEVKSLQSEITSLTTAKEWYQQQLQHSQTAKQQLQKVSDRLTDRQTDRQTLRQAEGGYDIMQNSKQLDEILLNSKHFIMKKVLSINSIVPLKNVLSRKEIH